MMKTLFPHLKDRYMEMSQLSENPDTIKRIPNMLKVLEENIETWPHYKIGVWIGCIQTTLIHEKITSFEIERDFTRPLHHQFFKDIGAQIPKTIDVMTDIK